MSEVIPLPFLAGKTVAVMGLGKSGVATVRALDAAGVGVWAWDDDPSRRTAWTGPPLVDLTAADLAAVEAVIWSPGIPHTHPRPHPVADRARTAGRPVVCDVELLALARPAAHYVGITGTNGKSTTTALIAHILGRAGRRVEAGGNLGTPALDLAPLGADGTYVLELSSYQLELIERARLDVAVLLNLTPDHLARHGGMDGYVAAKRRIVTQLKPGGGRAVIGVDDPHGQALEVSLADHAVAVSALRPVAGGVHAEGGVLIDHTGAAPRPILDLRAVPTLPGRHNWQNATAAYAACRSLGLAEDAIATGIRSYPGLPHRQELIAEIDGVRYVNDSKATNADAAEKALVCYDGIYWIAGGLPKEGGIGALAPHFGRIAHAFLIGQAAAEFARTLDGSVPYTLCETLDVAVAQAHRRALAAGRANAVVLLSPACASWDQFTDFEARGNAFRALVETLPRRREA